MTTHGTVLVTGATGNVGAGARDPGRRGLEKVDLDVTPEERLLVVAPEAQHLDHAIPLDHLVHQPALNVDSARVGAGEIAYKLLERGWRLKRVVGKNRQQLLSLRFQSG